MESAFGSRTNGPAGGLSTRSRGAGRIALGTRRDLPAEACSRAILSRKEPGAQAVNGNLTRSDTAAGGQVGPTDGLELLPWRASRRSARRLSAGLLRPDRSAPAYRLAVVERQKIPVEPVRPIRAVFIPERLLEQSEGVYHREHAMGILE